MPRDRESFTSLTDTVDPGYFGTLGIPIVRGRDLRASDDAKSPRVAVVNEQFAKHYWPGAEAVGRHVRIGHRGGVSVEIVGVARTIKYKSTTERPLDFVYRPLAQRPTAQLALTLRTTNEPLQTAAPLKALVRTLDPNLPVVEMRTFDDLYRYNAVEGPGVAIRMVGTMGGVALLLAIAGLYGLIAYNVNRRTHEIGIRMALGATPRDVLRLVMGKSLTLVAAGTAIGLALGFLVERLMNSMLFEGSGVDVGVYLIVVPAMLLVTMLAAYIPARRAAQIEPTRALRCD